MGDQIKDRLMLDTAELLRNDPSCPFVDRNGGRWQEFPPDKFILGLFKQKSGHPVSGATFRVLINLWAMSNFTWEWYLNFVQIFGVPLRVAKVDPNTPDPVKLEIDALLADMGSTGYIRLPNGNEIEIKDALKGGNDSTHKVFLEYADQICRKRILGQTLTGGEGEHGTNALGKVHATVRNDRIQTCAKRGVKILNTQVIPAIGRANFGDARLLPKFKTPEKDNEDPLEKMQRMQIFTTIAPMEEEELYDIAGFRVPQAGAKTIGGQAVPGPNTPGGGPGQVGQPKLPNDEPAKLNPEKDGASTAQASAAELAGRKPTTKDFAAALSDDLAPVAHEFQALQAISNDALYLKKMREFIAEHGPLVKLLADINASPKAAKVLNDAATVNLAQALARQATARAGGGNPNHDAHGLFSSYSSGGGGGDNYDPHEEQRKGEAAMRRALETKADVNNAMRQRELGEIDFKWGDEGDGAPDYKGGKGIAKIAAKHPEALAKMPEVIAHGKITEHQGNVVIIEKDGWKAVLTKTTGRDANHWLLSGYLPNEKGGGR
jgi:hypothetical protein